MSMVGNQSFAGVFPVTPADGVDLAIWADAIRVVVAGNVSLIGADGVTTTAAFTAGETRTIRAKRIRATGTTATGIEGLHY